MYPRNNASPPTIGLGEIVLKADGTQQTTGVLARVKTGSGAWGAAAGSLLVDATSGIWTYTPTQAETNADFFIVAAYKASCTSISKTIVTSLSSVSGFVHSNVTQISGDSEAADMLEIFTENLDNDGRFSIDSFGDNSITDDSISAAAVTKIQVGIVGSSSITIQPSIGYGVREVAGNVIEIATDAARVISRTVYDEDENEVTLPTSARFVICDPNGKLVATLTPSVSGASYSVTIPRSICKKPGDLFFAFRRNDNSYLDYDSGILRVVYVAFDPDNDDDDTTIDPSLDFAIDLNSQYIPLLIEEF
jgi:hypothetical protein